MSCALLRGIERDDQELAYGFVHRALLILKDPVTAKVSMRGVSLSVYFELKCQRRTQQTSQTGSLFKLTIAVWVTSSELR